MISRLIEKNIKSLTKEDIIKYSMNENIVLNSNEVDIIYNIIKNDYKILLYGDSKPIFDNLKSRINPTSYQKIYELYNFYKNKYKNYL